MGKYCPRHFICLVILLLSVALETYATFSRQHWVEADNITAFTTCGLDIGPVYASVIYDSQLSAQTSLNLWIYDYKLFLYNITKLACHKYGDINQDIELAAIFTKLSQSQSLTHVGLFKITEGSRALVNMNFNYTYNDTQVQATSISLERSMLCIQYMSNSQTSLISIHQVGIQPAIINLEFQNANISSLLDNEANLGVYDPSYPKFTLYYGDRYQHSYSVLIKKNQLCRFNTQQVQFRMQYQQVKYPQDDQGNYNGDQDVPYYIQSRFHLIFIDIQVNNNDCNIAIEVLRFPKYPTRKQASEPYSIEGNPSYVCDGRYFYRLRGNQNGIDESQSPIIYSDIIINQPIVKVLCSRRSSIFPWMPDTVVFYLLSQDKSKLFFQSYIDVYQETYVLMWILVSFASLCCCCHIVGCICCISSNQIVRDDRIDCTCNHQIDYKKCLKNSFGILCLDSSQNQLKRMQHQLEI